jgi:hypothetical protein
MAEILLFTVEHAFHVAGRGCVIAPGPSIEPGASVVKRGDAIRLKLPAGQVIETVVAGFELIKRIVRPEVLTAPLFLPKELTKDQVPIGTQVFLVPPPGENKNVA